jgi:excisionase family DNA binding protein
MQHSSRSVVTFGRRTTTIDHALPKRPGGPTNAEVAAPADPEVLTVEQAAELLQVDTDTIRALARQGELPGRKVGREWRFSRAAVLAWLGGDA